MNERTHLDLFTGIGGFSLAARANGVRTIAMCESEGFLRSGLESIWQIPVWPDARNFDARPFRGVWLYTAGTPCQPASRAGKQRGEADDRWLWPETVRVLQESEPAWFLGENPPGILDVGLDGILDQVERVGYEVQTFRIPACAVDSPQDRDRVWIVGHRRSPEWRKDFERAGYSGQGVNGEGQASGGFEESASGFLVGNCERNNGGLQLQPRQPEQAGFESTRSTPKSPLADAKRKQSRSRQSERPEAGEKAWLDFWQNYDWIEFNHALYRIPTGLYGVADGLCARIPKRFHSKLIAALGNAICWPVAAEIIRAMILSESHV